MTTTTTASASSAQEYIAAGDAFQIVLARTFSRAARGARSVRRLSRDAVSQSVAVHVLPRSSAARPARRTRTRIAGASPETMVRLEDGTMTVRPLAGTRRARQDAARRTPRSRRELLADPKERAEHVMLIDLGAQRRRPRREDRLGRARAANMEVERYSHVMHIVSEVRGKVAPTARRRSRSCAPRSPPARSPARPRSARCRSSASSSAAARRLRRRHRLRADGRDLDFAIAIRTMVCARALRGHRRRRHRRGERARARGRGDAQQGARRARRDPRRPFQ